MEPRIWFPIILAARIIYHSIQAALTSGQVDLLGSQHCMVSSNGEWTTIQKVMKVCHRVYNNQKLAS